jgi:hypothetical protein
MVSSSQVSNWFNKDGDLSVPSRVGVPTLTVEYLVVAGGGGGGPGGANVGGGGGGAGGVLTSTTTVTKGFSLPITVGTGGAQATNGSNSVFGALTAFGGGAGSGSNNVSANSGGSGGGTPGTTPNSPGNGTSGQGFSGRFGQGTVGATVCSAGGGGGATSVGTQPASVSEAGIGGTGFTSSISGSSIVYGIGGNGRSYLSGANGASGAANTGNGGEGGAGSTGVTAGSGGSGIVILSYPTTYTITISAGLNGSTAIVGAKKVTTITSGTGNVNWEINSTSASDSARIPPITTGLLAVYDGDSWNGTSWRDIYGTNHATITRGTVTSANATGSGASKSFTALYGDVNAGLRFPAGILPSTYTLFHVTRTTGGARSRIVTGSNNNWLSGHWSGGTGVAFHEGWLTGQPDTHGNNWFYSTDQNSLYRSNGVTRGTGGGGASTNLTINHGIYAEYSDWSVAFVAVYTGTLSPTDYSIVESWIASRYGI